LSTSESVSPDVKIEQREAQHPQDMRCAVDSEKSLRRIAQGFYERPIPLKILKRRGKQRDNLLLFDGDHIRIG